MGGSWAVWVVPLLALAGCSTSAPQEDAGAHDSAGHMDSDGFRIDMLRCMEGGGHSVHPKLPDYLPDPWEPADVMPDTGTPPLYSEWWAHPEYTVPEDGNSMGNWHVGVACDEVLVDGATLADLTFGYVGMLVEPPAFDTGAPADRHYLVTVIATGDEDLMEALHHHGFHAVPITEFETVISSEGVFHSYIDTDGHGIYESYFVPDEGGDMPATTRLWFQMENEDGSFSPISLDLANVGGTRMRAEGFYGTFTHTETQDHEPLPGAGGECPGLAYSGFDRIITLGPRPNVTLPEAYVHL